MDRRGLLVSDLDGTLLGDDSALERFAAWFRKQRARFLLAYASGRFFSSVADTVQSSALPEPDAVIGGVGSEIVRYPSGSCVWSPAETPDGQWNPYTIKIALQGVAGLRLQPSEFQSPYKVSFYLEGADRGRLHEIEGRLRDAAIKADIIYSSSRDLDVLPVGVNKGSAVKLLADWAGIDHGNIVVAGDTGNDLSMFERGYLGIVVANAGPVLQSLTGASVYHARGSYATGVLEGVKHWLSKWDRHEPSRSGTSKGRRCPAQERHRAGVQRL